MSSGFVRSEVLVSVYQRKNFGFWLIWRMSKWAYAIKLYLLLVFLPPANEVWGKVIFSEVCVKNSVHRGVCLSACWDTPPPGTRQAPPWDQAPSRTGTSKDQAPLQTRHPPNQVPPPGPGAPPGPGTPTPRAEHAGSYSQWAGGMHPTGMQSCCVIVFAVSKNFNFLGKDSQGLYQMNITFYLKIPSHPLNFLSSSKTIKHFY